MAKERPRTLGELRASGYRFESVKDEMRRNLIARIRDGRPLFPASSATRRPSSPRSRTPSSRKHDMLFLGLRGQAKTRMLRQLVHLLDEAMPVVAGSEINDDPYRPALQVRAATWSPSRATTRRSTGSAASDRYHEKLATPDVTIADLIGEIDLIKHAEGRYLSSELTMHFGLIPRTNRGIFCINELPDLSPKIQVGLFNVLEERDVQIRGYPIRLDLDVCMVFSANPEDYTNRGRIVTPLKDRIGSVVRTHYPLTRELGIAISDQNAWLDRDGRRGWRSRPSSRRSSRRSPGWRGRRRTSTSSRASRSGCRSPTSRTSSPTPSGGPCSTASAGSCRGSPTWPTSRQLARQARADHDRGRRAGRQADRPDRRRGGQERLRPAPRRPRVPRDGRATSSRARGWRSATRSRPRDVLSRIEKVPGLRKRADELGPGDPQPDADRRRRPRRRHRRARPSSSSKGCTSTTS